MNKSPDLYTRTRDGTQTKMRFLSTSNQQFPRKLDRWPLTNNVHLHCSRHLAVWVFNGDSVTSGITALGSTHSQRCHVIDGFVRHTMGVRKFPPIVLPRDLWLRVTGEWNLDDGRLVRIHNDRIFQFLVDGYLWRC